MRIYTMTALLIAGLLCAVMPGCKSEQAYRQDRAGNTLKHIEQAKQLELRPGQFYSLQQCINEALKNNLEIRIRELEEEVTSEFAAAEAMGMLPQLKFDNNARGRNEPAASSSKKLVENGATYGASISEDRFVNYLNIDLMFSTIDFGLAYFNTRQQADRVLMRKFRTERARQTLVFDVVKAYYKMAAAQRATAMSAILLDKCRTRIAQLKKENLPPSEKFERTKDFLRMERTLKGLDTRILDMEELSRGYDRAYEVAAVELRSLMGYYPKSSDFRVDESELDKMQSLLLPNGSILAIPGVKEKVGHTYMTPVENLSEIETMEQIAVMKRPELFEIDIQRHINVLECRKTILMMFPNVQLYADWSNSNNSYLYNKSWWELGARAAYNLLKLPKQVAKYKAYSSQVETEEMRSYAKAIAVMAEIRIAHGNLINAKEKFDHCRKLSAKYQGYHEAAVENLAHGRGVEVDVDLIEMENTLKNIESIVALGNYYVAYYRLLHTMGLKSLDTCSSEELLEELEDARNRNIQYVSLAKQEDDTLNRKRNETAAKQQGKMEEERKQKELDDLRSKVNAEIDAKIKAEQKTALKK